MAPGTPEPRAMRGGKLEWETGDGAGELEIPTTLDLSYARFRPKNADTRCSVGIGELCNHTVDSGPFIRKPRSN